MTYAKPTSSTVLHLVISPLMILLVLQMPGCTKKAAAPPPPGGVYRSTNAGATFAQSVPIAGVEGAHIATYSLGTIHRVPETPTTIYIAAADQGVVFSTDDGQSWQRVTTPLRTTSDVQLLKNGTLVIAGIGGDTQGYIMRSLDQGRTWDTVHTVPVPTKPKTFNLLGGKAAATSVITSLVIDPFEPDRIYAATTLGSIFVGEQSGKVWRTIHTLNTSIFGNNQSNNLGISALVASSARQGELLLITTDKRLVRIRDGKQERIRVPYKGELVAAQYYDNGRPVVDVSYVAGNPNMIFVGAGDGALLTRDDAKTWQALDLPVESTVVFNTVNVTTSPTNARRLFVTLNDVIYRSEDGGSSWNTYSLELSPYIISDFSINPANPSTVLLVTRALKT